MAFTQNVQPTFPKQPRNSKIQIANATNLANVTIWTPGASGSKIQAIFASSTDTSPRDVVIKITNGGTDYTVGTKTVPASSGFAAGTPAVNLLDSSVIPGLPIDSDGNPYLYLIDVDTLTAAVLTQLTAAKLISLFAIGSDF